MGLLLDVAEGEAPGMATIIAIRQREEEPSDALVTRVNVVVIVVIVS